MAKVKASKLYWQVVVREYCDGEIDEYEYITGLRNFDKIDRVMKWAHRRNVKAIREYGDFEAVDVYEVVTTLELDHSSICIDNSDDAVDCVYLTEKYEI